MKKLWNRKRLRYSLGFFLILIIAAELFARFSMGLGDMPVYQESAAYEYIYAPNQDVKRFGNRIQTNAQSMRSKPLSKKDKKRILLIGDSVINGGAHVDQNDLCSTILEDELRALQSGTRVLNISAGSWGPDNAFAYIKEEGDFDAKMIVLAFSSHDYHDNMHHRKVVGKHQNWPDSKPWCALADGWSRYAWPKLRAFFGSPVNEYAYLEGHDDSAVNSGWKNFINYCVNKKIRLFVYIHPEWPEYKNGKLNAKGQKLIKLLKKENVDFVNGINYPHEQSDYRDNIHLNAKGHAQLAEIMLPLIQQRLAN